MKRRLALGLLAFAVSGTAGCPIYSDNAECYDSYDCPGNLVCSYDGRCVVPLYGPREDGGTYGDRDSGVADAAGDAHQDGSHPADSGSSDGGGREGAAPGDGAALLVCAKPNDCAAGETCASDGICRAGDCGKNACVNQFECAAVSGGLACVPGNPLGCGDDGQCASGQKCVDGICTTASALCSDRTQCPAGDACVEGKCVTTCAVDAACPPGYRCRVALGVCTTAAIACVRTNDCGDPAFVCADGACVPRCSARGACGQGNGVCVENGCIPSQKVVVQCGTDGATAGCGTGQICLHHRCYVSCDPPNAGACAAEATANVCKTITTESGAHAVCASTTNLGGECDPTAGLACAAAKTCIDGFCR